MTTAMPVPWGPRASPAAVPRVAWGEGGPAEGMSFRVYAEANDPQLGPTLWGATTSARHPPAGMPPGDEPLFWRWLRWIFIGSAPGASDAAGAPLLLSKAVGCVWLAKTNRASPPVVDASFRSFASPQAAKRTPSTASHLPTEPASLGFGGGPVFAYVTGAAAPRVARIGITLQALGVAALYQVRPPGRHRCHAAEIPWRLW